MKRSTVLEICVRAEFHTMLLVSLYLLFVGHSEPGGGFSGGLVAASAFGLRFIAGGVDELRRSVRVAPTVFLGSGLLIAVVTGLTSVLLGGQFLESAILKADLPVLGTVKTSTVLFFDLGVYLVVLGMVLLLLFELGGEAPETASADSQAGPVPEEAP